MNPLDFIPPQYKVAAIALVVLLAGLAVVAYGHAQRVKGERIGETRVQGRWDAEVRQQQADAIARAAANAKETLRRLERQQEAQLAHDAELTRAKSDAAAAGRAADRVRERAEQLAAAARGAACHSAAGVDGAPGADPAGMLADVLGRVTQRARFLAEYGDASRAAGVQCERAYEALTAPP